MLFRSATVPTKHFGVLLGRLLGLARRQNMKAVSDVLLASICDQTLMDFGTKFVEDENWL